MEVKQFKIIKNTVQRKNPIVQQKINQVSKQRRTRSRASTSDKLAVVPSMIQSPDPQDSAEHEAWIRQRSDRQRSISLTTVHRQRDRCASDVTKESSNSPNRSPRTVEMHQVQSIDTVDNISVNWQEISEIMQSKDKCQRYRRNGNSRKFTDRIVDVSVVRKRQCQQSAQVLDQVPTTGAQDAKRSERQSTSESDAKCKDKIHEKES